MGGLAFSDLFTPRMPSHIYNLILSRTLIKVQQHFRLVSSPIQAPGKLDFGDIDLLCHGPFTPPYNPFLTSKTQVTETIAKELGAKAWILGPSMQGMNFAIPWPEEKQPGDGDGDETHLNSASSKNRGGKEDGAKRDKFIQLDIHIFPTLSAYTWELFHVSHGDLWNILGRTIRYFGLTVNNVGLFLRIPDIELHDRKKSMIFLTDEPNKVLEFLGLDPERWWRPFNTPNEMFEYAAGCRMFSIQGLLEDGEGEGEEDVVGEIQVPSKVKRNLGVNGTAKAGQEGHQAGKKKLKNNDRKRMKKRPIFRAWVKEFIPKCRSQGLYLTTRASRDDIRDEAFKKFAVKPEFDTRLQEWKLNRHKYLMRGVINGTVPTEDVNPELRAASVRFLKAVLIEGELWKGRVLDEAKRNKDGFGDLDAVREFVLANWEEAGRLGMVLQEKRAKERSMKAKAEQKAKLAEDAGRKALDVTG